ncbi:MAG: hypothetical protein KGO81_13765 [Bacteroidota bacterium]|nr:hypothetical protein [Bacteroidota bacterium]
MKPVKMLLVAALSIMLFIANAQDSTRQRVQSMQSHCISRVPNLNIQSACSSLCGKALNLSVKEQMKWSAMKLYTCTAYPAYRSAKPGPCNLCSKEESASSVITNCDRLSKTGSSKVATSCGIVHQGCCSANNEKKCCSLE